MAVSWVGAGPSAHQWVFNAILERLASGIASRKQLDQTLKGKRTLVFNLMSELVLEMAGT